MASLDKGKAKDTGEQGKDTTSKALTIDMIQTQAGEKRTSDQRSPQTPVAPPPKRERYDPTSDKSHEQRTYEQYTHEQRAQADVRYDPILGRYMSRSRPADHLRTTPATPTTDAPTTPAHRSQFEQGSSTSSSEQSWRHLDKLKGSLAKKGKWNNELAQEIRKAGGLTKDEITKLRRHLKEQYPGATLSLESSNYNNEYKQHYAQIELLGENYIATAATRNNRGYNDSHNQMNRDKHSQFGARGSNPAMTSWQLPSSK
jgi:hypothetical protein